MATLLHHLDELDRLVRTARTTGMKSETFVSECRDAIKQIWSLSTEKTNPDFLNADYTLTETIATYEKHPTPQGVGAIGNALVRYRRTATS
jgi:hypothetical protein